ncbi:MAG TPA: DUF4157 domain-containing protein [Pseudonocardiaceae bacterium]|nr:DUF4157 domain-containing protein [Pseudonocardiaceae bacterium]
MRWPFRRRDLPSAEPVAAWTKVTVWSRPPITTADTFGLPDVAGTRSLLARPAPTNRLDAPSGRVYGAVAVPRGVVTVRRSGWLRHLLARRPSVAPEPVRPWAVRVLERPAAAPGPLTVAAGEYVAAPTASWVDYPAPVEPSAAPALGYAEPDPATVGGWITDESISDLRAILTAAREGSDAVSQEPAHVEPRQAPTRRLSLAESRRLGIAASRPPRSNPEPSTEPPAERLPTAASESRPAEWPPVAVAEPRSAERPPTAASEPQPGERPLAAASEPQPAAPVEWPPVVVGQPRPAERPPTAASEPQPAERPLAVASEPQSAAPFERPPVVVAQLRPAVGAAPPAERSALEPVAVQPIQQRQVEPIKLEPLAPEPIQQDQVVPEPERVAPELMAFEPVEQERFAPDSTIPESIAPEPVAREPIPLQPIEPALTASTSARPAPVTMPEPVAVEPIMVVRRPEAAMPAIPPAPQRRLGLGDPLPPRERPAVDQLAEPPPPIPAHWTEPAPNDLVTVLGAAYGVDVSGTQVHRGTEVATRADAHAYTAAGEVYLPGPPTRAALAHELTHVAQQRILGADLPAEWAPAGQALESEAVATERWVLNGESGPPLVHAPVATVLATLPEPAAYGLPPTVTTSTSDGVQRQPVAPMSWTAPDSILALFTNPTETQTPPADTAPIYAAPITYPSPPTYTPSPAYTPPPEAAQPPEPAPTTTPVEPTAALLPTGVVELLPPPTEPVGSPEEPPPEWLVDQELVEHRDRLVALCGQRPANLDDVLDMEELAVKVYHRLRGLLRMELIVDRERAGLLTDFR